MRLLNRIKFNRQMEIESKEAALLQFCPTLMLFQWSFLHNLSSTKHSFRTWLITIKTKIISNSSRQANRFNTNSCRKSIWERRNHMWREYQRRIKNNKCSSCTTNSNCWLSSNNWILLNETSYCSSNYSYRTKRAKIYNNSTLSNPKTSIKMIKIYKLLLPHSSCNNTSNRRANISAHVAKILHMAILIKWWAAILEACHHLEISRIVQAARMNNL